ncbi:hypothetical protein ATY76_18955 [Rhizobium sp. R339]|uniref:AAA family ATPase n=1 Tax=Rhizobium sp. R339 TaxID=1764273 RepID=UPI000B52D264|nr:AAA family ATPase [Rhizobium sp. R339]OWV65337.1 hypothetical protein ATY76_18955 [Rhizobium sp. R339]
MTPKLKSLTIENFRSIRGTVVVPLDAHVVLVHGSNGMGKTSVLSALELGLTGSIAHLDRRQSRYQEFLTNIHAKSGSIQLSVENLPDVTGRSPGALTFSSDHFKAEPVLPETVASFFAERCYLPQAVLGRLLEIYDEQKKGTHSELTQFVKELLRLDPLDALVDGLDHAFNVTRVRKIAPSYKQLEGLLENYEAQASRLATTLSAAEDALRSRRQRIGDLLSKLFAGETFAGPNLDVGELRGRASERGSDEQQLSALASDRAELLALQSRLNGPENLSADLDVAAVERVGAQEAEALQAWLNGPGVKLTGLLDQVRKEYADLAIPDLEFHEVTEEAVKWCSAEIIRCDRVLAQHDKAVEAFTNARAVIDRASARIREINEKLEAGAKDARALANALAGVAPHVEGDTCPVCSRDYAELKMGSLTAHIAATIANLTTEAGQLQALAAERADESQRLATAQRDLVAAEGGALSAEDLIRWRQKKSTTSSLHSQLTELSEQAAEGSRLGRSVMEARLAVSTTRRALLLSVSVLPELENIVSRVSGRPVNSFETPQAALAEALDLVGERVRGVEERLSLRIAFVTELDQYERENSIVTDRRSQRAEIAQRAASVRSTVGEINAIRDKAKFVAQTASSVRSNIVRGVFSGSLNKVWRDLFVRLAPAEQFVPQFKLPTDAAGKVEAVLQTVHRSGKAAGTPGAMLSQGNLNTSALTLFLALNLSVPAQLPWLVLDDPVQSMDDVHIAQFAALLRTLAKDLGKQVIVAVHERALFDYLALELSPAFAGDSLITVEISRSFDGNTVADPKFFEFVDDKAVAA